MDEHMLRAATKARSALAVLAAELGEPSPDMAQALAIIEQMLGDIEAGRHPLDRPDDWPQRDRWPDRPHWDRWRWAIKTLAVASGTTAHCSQKYEYMRVDTRQARSDALTGALLDIADVIELASVREPSGTIDSFTGGWWPPAADRQVAEMPPPVAQRQVPSDDPTIMHAVYVLADYPVLAALAAERTQATRLDGRACRAIYEDARQRIDWQAMPPHEREFAQRLGVGP